MTPYERVLVQLKRSQMSRTALVKITGIPYGAINHVLAVLLLEGKILKEGDRYKIKGAKW